MKNFVSVNTNAARLQDISLNPQKLAGMCAKLKCCMNYEVDNYMEASRKMPPKDAVLETCDGEYYQFKTDIIAGLITYSTDKKIPANLETITTARAKEIIEMNKRGEKPESLGVESTQQKDKPIDLLANESITRFDNSKKKKKNNRNKKRVKPSDDQQRPPRKEYKGNRNNKNRENKTSE